MVSTSEVVCSTSTPRDTYFNRVEFAELKTMVGVSLSYRMMQVPLGQGGKKKSKIKSAEENNIQYVFFKTFSNTHLVLYNRI